MSKKSNGNRFSPIANGIFIRFIISELLLLLVLVGGFFLSYAVCSQFTWYRNDILYGVLKLLQALSPILVFGGFFGGSLILMYMAIKKPLSYLDEIIRASKTLSAPTQEPITLSPKLVDVQNELNLAREQALVNASLAADAVQRKNDLIMYLAHDLKTPLTSVIGYLTLLRDEGEISEELRSKYLSISLEKAERLEDLINEFFEIARFNLSNITLDYSKINLTRLLEQLVFEFQPMLAEKNLTCRLDIAPDTMLSCDAGKLSRVFDNLLRNAVNYSFEGGEISISAKVYGERISISVKNSGNTIPPEKLGRIFEQFYRLDTARSSKSGGAGLGLAIAKEIVTLHGGYISAKSENETVEFVVTIPLVGKS